MEMKKAVTYVGNSLAIVIDRTAANVMGIGYGSIVKVSFDGIRMILEATGTMKAPPPRSQPRRGPSIRTRRRPERVSDLRKPILIPALDEEREVPIERLSKEHKPIVEELLYGWGISLERINEIDHQHSPVFIRAHQRMLSLQVRVDAPADLVVARRLRYIYMELLDRDDWERVITLACALYPLPSSDAMSAGSGADAATVPPSG